MVFWLKVARELTSSFTRRCGIIHNLYHLGSAEDLRPHLLLANTLAGFIAPAPTTSFESLPRFLFATRQRPQLLRARDSSKKSDLAPSL